ncbi:hypothetical protein [Promicromonospora sp. NPDC060271]|uniref:hypothetical protein n=1 Tax=Promicromonospora sp. NPDC060271 TaxID=3347089 RepID=UPI00364F8664
MAEASSFPPIEISRRAFLVVGSAVTAAGYVALPSTPAYAASESPATATDEPPTNSHRTLLGLL